MAYIDLEKHPPAGVTAPLDLSCKPFSCWLYVPACGLGDPAEPSYVRFRVQDAGENREYGARTPVVRNQWFEFVLRPSTVAPLGGSMDPGFDPHRIVKVEVEFGTRAQGITYRGKVYLDACGWQEIDPQFIRRRSALTKRAGWYIVIDDISSSITWPEGAVAQGRAPW